MAVSYVSGLIFLLISGTVSVLVSGVVGLIVGLVFALCAYFFYSLAVVLLGASLGYWVGTGLLSLIGIDKGFISALVGITLGIVFAIATIGFNAAKYLLIALTSFAGGLAIIKGLLLAFGKIERTSLDYITNVQTIENNTFWLIALVILFIIGLIVQIKTTKKTTLDSWTTAYGAPKQSKIVIKKTLKWKQNYSTVADRV